MELTQDTILKEEHETTDTTVFGFWVYILTDCMLFAGLFAVYAVLHVNTFGGPTLKEITSLPYILSETLILLTSSFMCGLGMIALRGGNKKLMFIFFSTTVVLGSLFVGMEISEFSNLVHEGYGPQKNAFLSSFFTLVGTHGLHVSVGLLWLIVLMAQIQRNGITPTASRRLTCLSLFWYFLEIIWIFIFTFVYLMGFI